MFKYYCTDLNGVEQYTIGKSANDSNADSMKSTPKYLEILYNDNEDESQPVNSNPYEIPLPDLDDQHTNNSCNSSVINVQIDKDKNSYNLELSGVPSLEHAKERTFSSSSTVSEASVYCAPPPPPPPSLSCTNLAPNIILKVALPNTKEDCSSNDKLLTQQIHHHPTEFVSDKLRQFYENTNVESVLSCDGITSM